MSVRPWTPSCCFASWRPLFARKLNERSLRPPMSVTSPTLICLPDDAAVDEPLVLDVLLPLSLLPHAAIPRAPTARLRAITTALDVLRCTAPPFGIPPRRDRTPSVPARQSTAGTRRRRRLGPATSHAAALPRSSPRSRCV